MTREAQIPLLLWIPAALVAHLVGGGGAVEAAKVHEGRQQIRQMVVGVREQLAPADTTIEILSDVTDPTPPEQPLPPPEVKAQNDSADDGEADDAAPSDVAKPEPPKAPKLAKPEPPKEEPKTEPPKVDPPKEAKAEPPPPPAPPPPPLPVIAKTEPIKPLAPPPPPPPPDGRIAIRQHVEKDQPDNASATRIADDANKVEEETMARIRSKDQDDPTPTPGSASGPQGPKDKVGDSDHEKSAQSEDKAGNDQHAPGEGKTDSTSSEHHNPAKPSPAASPLPAVAKGAAPSAPGQVAGGAKAAAPRAEVQAQKGTAGGSGPASPEVVAGESGGYTLNPANPGGDGKARAPGKKKKARPYQSPVRVGSIGLGAPGLPGGPNLNLTMAGVEQAVGHEQLKAERAGDGASRRSAHRGSWETNKWEKWKAAIENYDPSVKPGNQTALNAARVPFASYINGIHNRLHPIFAEEFLVALENLPKGHAFNQHLVAHVEIVLNKDSGRIVRIGVTKASGMTAFDIVALNSVSRASPFGKAPDAIVSPDGNVYLHWEFHRDPFDACTTRNARPFMLKEAPSVLPVPTPKKPPRTTPSDERAAPGGPILPLGK